MNDILSWGISNEIGIYTAVLKRESAGRIPVLTGRFLCSVFCFLFSVYQFESD